MSFMEGSSAAQRPQIICIEVPGPKESPSSLALAIHHPMHPSAVKDYTCLSSAGCIQLSGALICIYGTIPNSFTNYM